jgi:NADH-quinone oxidoreductase subunit C
VTAVLSAREVASKLDKKFPGSIVESTENHILVKSESLLPIASFLKTEPEFAFDYLAFIAAVDYNDYFEVVYHLTSLEHNHSVVVKTRCYGRENLSLPSVVGLWRGADFQEREIYDLFGIKFEGHPNLKHIVLWEGFKGYPLRKDYIQW